MSVSIIVLRKFLVDCWLEGNVASKNSAIFHRANSKLASFTFRKDDCWPGLAEELNRALTVIGVYPTIGDVSPDEDS